MNVWPEKWMILDWIKVLQSFTVWNRVWLAGSVKKKKHPGITKDYKYQFRCKHNTKPVWERVKSVITLFHCVCTVYTVKYNYISDWVLYVRKLRQYEFVDGLLVFMMILFSSPVTQFVWYEYFCSILFSSTTYSPI